MLMLSFSCPFLLSLSRKLHLYQTVQLAHILVSFTIFSFSGFCWYTFKSSMNRLCVLFRFLLPDGPIMYLSDCSMSIATGTSVRQNPTGEKLSLRRNTPRMSIHLLLFLSFCCHLESGLPSTHELLYHLYHLPWETHPPVCDCHPVMMDLVISLLVVIIGYRQIPFVVPSL